MFNFSHRLAARFALATALAATSLVSPAVPHTHVGPGGSRISWYPKECCHEGDCRPIVNISRAPNGLWMTTVGGHTVLVGPEQQRRISKDMRWHICIGPDDVDNQTPRITCIFEPPDS